MHTCTINSHHTIQNCIRPILTYVTEYNRVYAVVAMELDTQLSCDSLCSTDTQLCQHVTHYAAQLAAVNPLSWTAQAQMEHWWLQEIWHNFSCKGRRSQGSINPAHTMVRAGLNAAHSMVRARLTSWLNPARTMVRAGLNLAHTMVRAGLNLAHVYTPR